jgi:hypothetical protein
MSAMTAKQKLMLVAAQYVAEARERTRQGDMLAEVAKALTEDSAAKVFDELVKLELVDCDGILTKHGAQSVATAIKLN